MRRIVAALLLIAAPAAALSIRREIQLLAWSKDGAGVLLLQLARGPEGGGETSFVILSTRRVEPQIFTVSLDLSPGGGDRASWQKVKPADCRRRVTALTRALAADGFDGVRTLPARCERDRAATVAVDPAAAPGAPGADGRYPRGRSTFAIEEHEAHLSDGAAQRRMRF